MTDKPIDLDQHRGISAQKATGLRRLLAEVESNERTLRLRQDELETQLLSAPAANWHDAAEKARLAKLLGREGTLDDLNRELARQLRAGERDERDAALMVHLEATIAAKIAIANPKWK